MPKTKKPSQNPSVKGHSGLCDFSLHSPFAMDQVTLREPSQNTTLGQFETAKMLFILKDPSTSLPKPATRHALTSPKKIEKSAREKTQSDKQQTVLVEKKPELNRIVKINNAECTNRAIEIYEEQLRQPRDGKHKQNSSVAILNLANEETIGGGAFNGAIAQEEYLFRVSDLPFGLLAYATNEGQPYFSGHRPYYGPGSFNATDVIYSENHIYRGKSVKKNGRIEFRYDDLDQDDPRDNNKKIPKRVPVNFVTSAALRVVGPNQFEEIIAGQRHVCDIFTADVIHAAKIYNQIKVAIDEGNTAIVLGAFGCGAFDNDPIRMAQLYRDILSLPEFIGKIRVEFAITSKKLCRTFSQVFEKPLEENREKEIQIKQKVALIHAFENDPKIQSEYQKIVKLNQQILPYPNMSDEEIDKEQQRVQEENASLNTDNQNLQIKKNQLTKKYHTIFNSQPSPDNFVSLETEKPTFSVTLTPKQIEKELPRLRSQIQNIERRISSNTERIKRNEEWIKLLSEAKEKRIHQMSKERDQLLRKYLKARNKRVNQLNNLSMPLHRWNHIIGMTSDKMNAQSMDIIHNRHQFCLSWREYFYPQGKLKDDPIIQALQTTGEVPSLQELQENIEKCNPLLNAMRKVNQYLTRRSQETSQKWVGYWGNDYYLRRESWQNILLKIQETAKSDNPDFKGLKQYIEAEAKKFKGIIARSDYYDCLMALSKTIPDAQ